MMSFASAAARRSSGAPLDFPSAARAARHAARQWFISDTLLSAAQFRDEQLRAHCNGREDSPVELRVRIDIFRRVFAAEIGKIVVEEGRFRAIPA
jgi:hypothetical protein